MLLLYVFLLLGSGILFGLDGGSLDLAWSEAIYNWAGREEQSVLIRFLDWLSRAEGGQLPSILLIVGCAVVFLTGWIASLRGRRPPRFAAFQRQAAIVVLAALAIGVISPVIKGTVARQRPRYELGNPEYTPWYAATTRHRKNPMARGSFTSGHTMQATLVFCTLYWAKFTAVPFWKTAIAQGLLALVCFAYVALMGLSRIALAKHWLSDVVFGGLIGFGLVAAAAWVIENRRSHTPEPAKDESAT